ncbi:MAG: AmmeMemoRadiSam system protein A [Candidatus Marinimicrobia bacterium]|jgi:AmmeMemoRadiSam system protein A|nr:AmmeMemoRadiSam system protein A [Candidatus Neomarinimicrobiota bacterium]MBT3633301.1 AmmeMemoRadiSam system protein A [Candidatus Neomarinimicrobiota bacterium]MBT3681444.1 AmmeMemoRadiSam system protein A [Candidatus Neomarinimicrobiota bacterium]MBT3758589.1 AmmeMemoRadiSam system protein A [Candidatus Neomarinimicrobiota bacterium]MBT3894757.1 AmmeMemoRadiSam system protein A [Candidatus Neomarinimicrobiota bacterium]
MDSPLVLKDISTVEKYYLMDLAMQTMKQACIGEKPSTSRPGPEMPNIQKTACSFVTLMKNDDLRGCIGSLLPTGPLFRDVIKNTISAMFNDPRFGKVTADEADEIHIQISILSNLEKMSVDSESDLLNQINPYVDGIVLQEGYKRSTFLPSVWDSLSDPVDFIRQLKRKAGLGANYWSDKIKIQRYSVLKLDDDQNV